MKLRMRGRILLLFIGVLVVIQGATVAYIGYMVREDAMEQAKKFVQAASEKGAAQLSGIMENFTTAALSLASSIGSVDGSQPNARDAVMNMTRHLLKDTPGAVSAWFAFEPDAFDGRDREYGGADGFRESGRFEAAFFRDGDSVQRAENADKERAKSGAERYTGVIRSGKPFMPEPYYTRTYTGEKSRFVTGVSVPVRIGGKIAGVVGIDLDLMDFSKMVNDFQVSKNSYNTLFSNKASFVYHPDVDMVGKSLEEFGRGKLNDLDHILSLIASGKEEMFIDFALNLGMDIIKVHVPVSLGGSLPPWSLAVCVPIPDVTGQTVSIVRSVVLTSVLGIIALCIAVFVIAGRIVKPIVAVNGMLGNFAKLDFRYDSSKAWLLTKYKNDEVADMLGSLREMQDSVADFVRTVGAVEKEVSGTSRSLASLTQETLASMEEAKSFVDRAATLSEGNSAALQETTAGVQEVSGGASNAAKSATDGSEAAVEMSRMSQETVDRIKAMMEMVKTVGDRSHGTVTSMSQVENSVGAIAGFVDTIASIADQTNLLALNAAIEAARAGEHGKGFAVVAEEVRKLAEESNGAAKKVADMITSLQDDAKSSTASMQEVDRMVNKIVDLSGEAIAGLDQGMGQIRRVESAMQDIAALSQEQAASSQEMASGIDSITKATLETAEILEGVRKGSEETAQATEQVALESRNLQTGAEKLSEVVAKFSLDDQDSRALEKV